MKPTNCYFQSIGPLQVYSWLCLLVCVTGTTNKVIAVAGATGYIGRQVVSELVRREIPTIALTRSYDLPEKTKECLQGAEIVLCDILDRKNVAETYSQYSPTTTICCLASRSGIKRDSWAVDYRGGLNALRAQEQVQHENPHYVFLSAYCCGKPELQFQFAKLKLEEKLQKSTKVSHSIVRPTAFFKSVDGQVESISKGYPALFFGNGQVAANAISEKDLASFLVDCAIYPQEMEMLNSMRDIGGPDSPPITKKQQLELIYNILDIPPNKRKYFSIPVSVLDFLVNSFASLENVTRVLKWSKYQQKFEDAAELARIVRYYATESMVAIGPGQIQGKMKLKEHFDSIAKRGGMLEEIDKMTTTTGVFELFAKNEYVK